MKNIKLISINTVRDIRRQKVFYALGLVAIFIMGVGIILGPLSLSEQVRLSINFAFTAVHIGMVLMAVYFASTLLSLEIEKKTVFSLFARPVSKFHFIVGKFLGLSFVLFIVALILTLAIIALSVFYKQGITGVLFIAIWGILLEALILVALGCFFSSIASSSFLVFVDIFFIFIIGHSANGVVFLLKNSSEQVLKIVNFLVVYVFPNFEKLNWRSHALYQDFIGMDEVLKSTLYAVSWIILLLILAGLIFERKNID